MVIAGSTGPVISQSEITKGSTEVPRPLTTPFAAVKFASDTIRIGPRPVLAPARGTDIGATIDTMRMRMTSSRRLRATPHITMYDVSRMVRVFPSVLAGPDRRSGDISHDSVTSRIRTRPRIQARQRTRAGPKTRTESSFTRHHRMFYVMSVNASLCQHSVTVYAVCCDVS